MIYRQEDNYRLVDNTSDPASDQQDPSLQLKHHVVSWLSTMRCPVDLTTKANPCLQIEEHKQEQG